MDLIARFYSETIPLFAKGKLADLGSGHAPLYLLYEKYVTDITCIDWENDNSNSPYIDIIQDLNQPLNITDQSFDTVLLSDVLEHIRKPELLISEIHRILTNNGILLMNIPFLYWIHEKPFDYFRYTEFALQSILEDNGFEIVRLEALGGSLEVLADLSSKVIARIPIIGKIYAIVAYKTVQWVVSSQLGYRISQRSAKTFPLAYAIIARKKT